MTSAATLVGGFQRLIAAAETVMGIAAGHRELAKPAGSPHRWPSFRVRLFDSPPTPKLPLRLGFTIDTNNAARGGFVREKADKPAEEGVLAPFGFGNFPRHP